MLEEKASLSSLVAFDSAEEAKVLESAVFSSVIVKNKNGTLASS